MVSSHQNFAAFRHDARAFDADFGTINERQGKHLETAIIEKLNSYLNDNAPDSDRENGDVPAGLTYLAQFIAHDMSFDPRLLSQVQRQSLDELENERTAALDLDCLYGRGPIVQRYLYRDDDKAKLRFNADDHLLGHDLPRIGAQAVIADPRNDDNMVIAQIHRCFALAHNKVCDLMRKRRHAPDETSGVFKEARRLMIEHYQAIIVTELLPAIAKRDAWEKLLQMGTARLNSIMPWVLAAFRLSAFRLHSMVRSKYKVNFRLSGEQFVSELLMRTGSGGLLEPAFLYRDEKGQTQSFSQPLMINREWRPALDEFFDVEAGKQCQRARKFSVRVASALSQAGDEPGQSVPVRTMLRGQCIGLPSGQEVLAVLLQKKKNIEELLPDIAPLTETEITAGLDQLLSADEQKKLASRTPLWFYLMREAEIRSGGKHLGLTGSFIVAATLLNGAAAWNEDWTPSLFAAVDPDKAQHVKNNSYSMASLIRFVEGQALPL